MRLRLFARSIFIGAFLQAAIIGLGSAQLHAQLGEIRLQSPDVSIPRVGTRVFEYYNLVGPGCGTCGGLDEGPFFSLELGDELWTARYWEVRGTYVDMVAGGPVYQYSSSWSLDFGRKVGEVAVYAGWTSLRHQWSPSRWTDLEGPTVGARWTAGSMSFDLAFRHASPNILGTSVRATLYIPLSENVSTSIGLDQWVYFVRPGSYWEWTNPYVGLKMEW